MEYALQLQQKKSYKLKESNDKLMTKLERLLHNSWHENDSKIPFLRNLHLLIENGKLSTFDTSFYPIGQAKSFMVATAGQMNKLGHWLFYIATNWGKKHTVSLLQYSVSLV